MFSPPPRRAATAATPCRAARAAHFIRHALSAPDAATRYCGFRLADIAQHYRFHLLLAELADADDSHFFTIAADIDVSYAFHYLITDRAVFSTIAFAMIYIEDAFDYRLPLTD